MELEGMSWATVRDILLRVALLGLCVLVWVPKLGCKAQQELLGVGSAEAVVETFYDAVLGFAVVLGMRFTGYFVSKRRRNGMRVRPSPTACLGPCSFI
jgi:hypothetical protein